MIPDIIIITCNEEIVKLTKAPYWRVWLQFVRIDAYLSINSNW